MKETNRLALYDARGLLTQILDCLSGQDGLYWMEVFKKTLRKENPFKQEVFKRIKLGIYSNVAEYRKALREMKYEVGNYAACLLKQVPISQTEQELDLVLATAEVLGVSSLKDLTYKEICNLAFKRGLKLCPAETALALRLQLPEQPTSYPHGDNEYGQEYRIAMQQLEYNGNPYIFHVSGSMWVQGPTLYVDAMRMRDTTKSYDLVFCK
jgi:hypothetical protein